MKNNKIPNCAICKWRKEQSLFIFCRGQGMLSASYAYNNKQCKKLFTPAETKRNKK